MNETEKLTLNLSVVELAQIDVLVEQGLYSNRSDFIRTAIRKQLEGYSERMDVTPVSASPKDNWTKTVGILSISRKSLEKLVRDQEKLSISVIGMLIIEATVDAALFQQAVDTVVVRGKLVAPEEVKKLVRAMG